jgi:hypothetical protein
MNVQNIKAIISEDIEFIHSLPANEFFAVEPLEHLPLAATLAKWTANEWRVRHRLGKRNDLGDIQVNSSFPQCSQKAGNSSGGG